MTNIITSVSNYNTPNLFEFSHTHNLVQRNVTCYPSNGMECL